VIKAALEEYHPLTGELRGPGAAAAPVRYFLVLALLPAVCEELAFRGFVLSGLARRFRPASAVLLSAFLFALYQMNVFQFVPYFLFGLVLGLLVLRTGSTLPAMLFHLVYNTLVIAPVLFPGALRGLADGETALDAHPILRFAVIAACALLAAGVLLGVTLLSRRRAGGRTAPPSQGPAPAPLSAVTSVTTRDLTRQAPS
jgi:sodium transport system permease protein